MEELLKQYEKALEIIKDKIKSLKSQLAKERNPRESYFLRRDLSSYGSIKNDLLFSIKQIKAYLGSK